MCEWRLFGGFARRKGDGERVLGLGFKDFIRIC